MSLEVDFKEFVFPVFHTSETCIPINSLDAYMKVMNRNAIIVSMFCPSTVSINPHQYDNFIKITTFNNISFKSKHGKAREVFRGNG